MEIKVVVIAQVCTTFLSKMQLISSCILQIKRQFTFLTFKKVNSIP